jgi:hypothetical protein
MKLGVGKIRAALVPWVLRGANGWISVLQSNVSFNLGKFMVFFGAEISLLLFTVLIRMSSGDLKC